jgi:hypothetical protein
MGRWTYLRWAVELELVVVGDVACAPEVVLQCAFCQGHLESFPLRYSLVIGMRLSRELQLTISRCGKVVEVEVFARFCLPKG